MLTFIRKNFDDLAHTAGRIERILLEHIGPDRLDREHGRVHDRIGSRLDLEDVVRVLFVLQHLYFSLNRRTRSRFSRARLELVDHVVTRGR